ncbi:hypothetical protein SAMN05444358_11371 [Ruegeria halocynthiae]|uniref:Uncharacterized protein n=1 Tax=Ruegeria halocynthiae TaxID=985054 RepID=A0A1H3F6E7_9RHOB|nr:hypothetical protein [Ruegeria halocynthiae]SDX86500.1 hypothetical protein SAMN05444358_11371 [Ruegeria halocynthiae]
MNDNLLFLDAAKASFSTRRSSHDPVAADNLSGSMIRDYGDLHDETRSTKYISTDAAKTLLEEERKRTMLFAIPFKKASLIRPLWTLEIHNDKGPRYVLQSRSQRSRPILAGTPSGVYGIAAEIGAEQVVLCMPKE